MCHSFLPVFNSTSDVFCVLQKSYARQVKLICQPYVYYAGCLKKMVIEFWSAPARSLYNLQKSLFHSRKDQAFSFRMSPFL